MAECVNVGFLEPGAGRIRGAPKERLRISLPTSPALAADLFRFPIPSGYKAGARGNTTSAENVKVGFWGWEPGFRNEARDRAFRVVWGD